MPRLSGLFFTSEEFMGVAMATEPVPILDYPGRALYRANVVAYNVGMAFELLYKVFALLDRGKVKRTHLFRELHPFVEAATKSVIELAVARIGFRSIDEFIRFMDADTSAHQGYGLRRYYEARTGLEPWIWSDIPQGLPRLARLHDHLSGYAAGRIWLDSGLPNR